MANNTTPDLRLNTSNKQILGIAIPIAASILVPQINFVTNNVFLGGLGEQVLAVAGITGVLYLIFAVVGTGLNNGLQALISRRAGENNLDDVGNIFNHGIRISVLLAVICIGAAYTIVPWLLRFSLHDVAKQNMAISFLKIRVWGILFLYIYQMRNALLVGTNNSRFLVIGTLAETIANIFFDYVLIYGKFGFPSLGLNGAAYASIIAEAMGLLVVFVVMHFQGISKQLKLYKKWPFHFPTAKLIVNQSGPLMIQFLLSIVSWEFFYILIEHHGTQDLAISNAMRNIFGIFGCGCWAFAATANTMVSNIIGQGQYNKVEGLIVKIMKLSVGFAVIVCIIINIFPATFLSIYGQNDAFIKAAIPVTRIVSTALVAMAISTVWINAVIGTGNSAVNLKIELIAILAYCTYVWYVLEYKNWPITIGWLSEWLYWIILFVLSFIYIKSGKWKHKKI
jgi:multidrug resistance protein, MATE family